MLYWAYLGVCIILAVVGAGFLLARAWRQSAEPRRGWRDLLALLTLVPAALFTVQPYVGADLIGAGDSYYYGLQVADFVTQARAGVMPVLIGQSDYAFNGNVHSVHTAPYFTHLAGLLDGLTLGRLSFVALQNLTVTVTAILAAWAAYAAGVLLSGGRRLAAWLLAFLYVSSPAIIGPLVLSDMFATYVAAPWLVLCWAGLAGILHREDDTAPQLVAAGALALTWYAHSPMAAWLSLVWVAVQGVRLGIAGGTRGHWLRQALTAACFLGLVAYAFACLATIDSGPMTPVDRPVYEFSPASVQRVLQAQFLPATLRPGTAAIQLGWSLWLVLVAAIATTLRFRALASGVIALLLGLLACFLIPSPLYETLWRLIPDQLAAQTAWPEQRLCPLLVAGIIPLAALLLRELAGRPAAAYRWVCALLAVACGWSAVETATLNHRPALARTPPAAHTVQYSPENVKLTRYSYVFASKLSPYFTHSWTDPEYEVRLLDQELNPIQDNASAVLATTASAEPVVVTPTTLLDFTGPGDYLLHFGFQQPLTSGEIKIHGAGVLRNYTLPRSGETGAFGSHPEGSKTIPLRVREPGTHPIAIATDAPGVSVRVLPVNRTELPFRLEGQTPYSIRVKAAAAGFLETPRLHLTGYQATINGHPAPLRPSPHGLVMIPVPAGESAVVLWYDGPWPLRAAWLLSLASLATFPWLLARAWRGPVTVGVGVGRDWIRHHHLLSGAVGLWQHRRRLLLLSLTGTMVAVGLALFAAHAWRTYRAYGALDLMIELPKQPAARAEPLLTVGKTGAADCIYVIYEDARHIRLGYDHWSYGGPVSEPIPVSYGAAHRLEISIRGLYPPTWWLARPDPAADNPEGMATFVLRLDGRVIFQQPLRAYPAEPHQIAVGANPVGSSVASAQFSGRILTVDRQPGPPPE